MIPSLMQLVVVLTVVGLLWYLVQYIIPLPQPVRIVATVIFVLVACIYLLQAFGVADFVHIR